MKKEARISAQHETFFHSLIPSRITITLLIFYIILIGAFLFILDSKTSKGFGLVEIIFAIVSACVLAALFVWINSLMRKNSYLGLISGIVLIVLLTYALFVRYKGPYTLIFAAIGAFSTAGYLIYNFFKLRAEDTH